MRASASPDNTTPATAFASVSTASHPTGTLPTLLAGLEALCAGCGQLASLDIGGCSRLTELTLHSIAAHCAGILSLDLGGCKHLVIDSALLALAAACKDLRSLNLRFCELVSEGAIEQVQAQCVNVQVRR